MCACCWTDCRLVHDKVFDFRGDMHSFSMFFIWMETLHVTYWVTVTYVTGCRCGFQLDQSWGPIAVERQISKARQEELGTTSWASWDTDTQLTATWPVGILKADDLWICQFSNHHSSNKMVSSKMSRSSTQIIVTCNDLHDIFSCLIGTLPISFCFGDYAVGARSEYSYQQETHPKKKAPSSRCLKDLTQVALRGPAILRSTTLPTSLAQVTYADPETAAWQGCRGVYLRQI